MSLSDRQSRLFLEPLHGKTTAIRLSDRESNLKFGASVLRLFVSILHGCRLLDLDAFYSSNFATLAAGVTKESLNGVEIYLPEPGSNIEASLAALFIAGDKPLMIDSANSLYQLLSASNPRAATRKFAFFASALSSWAKSNGLPALASFYDRRPAYRRRASKSLADVFDNSVSLTARPNGLSFRCERGSAWRGGGFFLPALQDS
jgi:hypothetical protein